MNSTPRIISAVFSSAVDLSCVALLILTAGCSRDAQKSKSNAFLVFVNWLQSQGETNVMEDATDVGLAGSATPLRLSVKLIFALW